MVFAFFFFFPLETKAFLPKGFRKKPGLGWVLMLVSKSLAG